MSYVIKMRSRREVNTDPQGRCYYGVYASSKIVWTAWENLEHCSSKEEAEERILFWRDLNKYAVSQQGTLGKREFKIAEEKNV